MTPLSDDTLAHLREVLPATEPDESRYEIGEPIGRGGMGVVYRARDRELDREVALKVLSAPRPRPDQEERLRREARIMARLEHPGIVPIHDVGRLADGRLFTVMKLVRGRPLEEAVDPKAPLGERLGSLERIAEAVAFAHAHGIIHRDLKPGNVMVGPFGEVLVMDWGIAGLTNTPRGPSPRGNEVLPPEAPAAVEGGETPGLIAETPPIHPAAENRPAGCLTNTGTILGTPAWMSPEQAQGRVDRIDERTDVYGLGALLHWLLIGRAPTSPGVVVGGPIVAGVPRPLLAVCRKALAPDPADRYATAEAFRDDLARFRDGRAVTAYREGPLERAGRFIARYRTPILLVLAYLLVRIAIFLWGRI